MRIKYLDVTFEAMAKMLRPDGGCVTSDFPKTAKVIEVRADRERYGMFRLVIEDESFPEVANGELLCEMSVRFRRYYGEEASRFASVDIEEVA